VRRRLIASLRYTAARAVIPPNSARIQGPLLVQRALEVRTDLLALAAALECDPDPDPQAVRSLLRLLTDGCDSPLFNASVHPSELMATLYYARRRLRPPPEDATIRPAAPSDT
jgi:hypothetical protein